MELFIPVLIAVLTALLGIVAYLFQKYIDRRNSLIELRKQEYKSFIAALQNNFEFNTHETLAEYHKSMMSLFVIASDKVIQAVGELNTFLAETSQPDKPRTRKDFENKLINVFEKMRLDCFEKSNLTSKELANLLPFIQD